MDASLYFNHSIRLFQYALSPFKTTHFRHKPEFLEVPFSVVCYWVFRGVSQSRNAAKCQDQRNYMGQVDPIVGSALALCGERDYRWK